MPTPEQQRTLEDYIQYYETLTPRSVRLIEKLASKDMVFEDPFNTVHGIDNVEHVLEKMFADIDKPEFRITDYSWGVKQPHIAYIRWVMTFEMGGKAQAVEGVSEVMFGENGQIMSHIDHWDSNSQLFTKLPWVGGFFRWVRKKAAVH